MSEPSEEKVAQETGKEVEGKKEDTVKEDAKETAPEPTEEQEKTGEGRDDEAGAGKGKEKEEEGEPSEGKRAVSEEGEVEDPPLPAEDPPLPPGPPPDEPNDGWEAIWEPTANAYYFYNSFTGVTTWENPRVPQDATGTSQSQDTNASLQAAAYEPGTAAAGYPSGYPPAPGTEDALAGVAPGVDGEGSGLTFYQLQHGITEPGKVTAEDIADSYSATGRFNRFTGKWQANKAPEDYSDESKSKRQMNFYFDVEAAANSHDGKSLRAERQKQKLSKKEVKAYVTCCTESYPFCDANVPFSIQV